MKKKAIKKDTLVARLTADRVLKGTASKNQVEHLMTFFKNFFGAMREQQEKNDSAYNNLPEELKVDISGMNEQELIEFKNKWIEYSFMTNNIVGYKTV